MDRSEIKATAFQNDETLYNKQIDAVPAPEKQIGIDLNDSIITNLINSVDSNIADITTLNTFTQMSRNRNDIYDIIDSMAEDTTLAAVLETYAEDATEPNDQGDIMWAESADPEVAKFINYLLVALGVNKNIYRWTHSLCKYGDIYLRLYRESEFDDDLFPTEEEKSQALNEDLIIKYYSKNDRYVHYLELQDNPAQDYELTRHGKTAAYIQTTVKATSSKDNNLTSNPLVNRYQFNRNDVELYQPTEFVHGALEDNTSRLPEEVELFISPERSIVYKVKRGQSLLYNSYKVWRQLMLLENSVLLNRLTQSSIVRVIAVEVGDMPKESVNLHLSNIKQLIEQKAAVDVGNSMSEYTNPGPVVNNIYIPTRNNQGTIQTQQIGGDVNVGELVDLAYYEDKLFGGLKVPKQYFGRTDDSAGFSGGQSLALISSRYAKMIKRIQNTMIQTITDAVNLILIDSGNANYLNRFQLKMQPPTTQEEVDRRDNTVAKVSLISDIMNQLTDIDDSPTKMKILKSLLSDVVTNTEVIGLLQEYIDKLEQEMAPSDGDDAQDTATDFSDDTSLGLGFDDIDMDLGSTDTSDLESPDSSIEEPAEVTPSEEPVSSEPDTSNDLPSPADLDIGDLSDSTNPNL